MFINTQKSVFSRMQVELGVRKDILAYAADSDSAQAIAMDIRDEIEFNDHINTGKMLNSITATTRNGEHVVTGTTYAKYVNGYTRESEGAGFIDNAVNNAILDGFEGEVAV